MDAPPYSAVLREEDWPRAAREFQEAWSSVCTSFPRHPALAWGRVEPGDELLRRPCFLTLRNVQIRSASGKDSRGESAPLWECEGEDEDVICAATVGGEGTQHRQHQHLYEFHIIYNQNYQVPELLLLGCSSDGRVLSLAEVLNDFTLNTPHSLEELSSIFLEKEHPHLLLPWVGIHLCELGSKVKHMLQAVQGASDLSTSREPRWPPTLQYMLTWWSAVGKFVSLHVPLHLWSQVKVEDHEPC